MTSHDVLDSSVCFLRHALILWIMATAKQVFPYLKEKRVIRDKETCAHSYDKKTKDSKHSLCQASDVYLVTSSEQRSQSVTPPKLLNQGKVCNVHAYSISTVDTFHLSTSRNVYKIWWKWPSINHANKQPVPYIDGIKGGMQPGRSVFIKGIPTRSPKRVTINLQTDYADDTDITLQFDIRFHYLGEYGVVVLNSRKDGSFGKEERVSNAFPFVPNEEFNLEITAESSRYKISVDNKHFADFNYRLPVKTGSVLSIVGDLTLNDVRAE